MHKTAATCGVFDILHVGHLSILDACGRLADEVIVFINSDESVRRTRGPGKPIAPLSERQAILEALAVVSSVVAYDEDTPVEAIERFFRHRTGEKTGDFFWLKDSRDYAVSGIPEAETVREYGGMVLYYDSPVADRRTSQITRKIREVLNESLA